MRMQSHTVRILVATQPVDVRKGHDGRAALVQSVLEEDPVTGTVVLFRAKRADRLKILFWEFAPVRRRRQAVRGTVWGKNGQSPADW
ncbi:MAG: hypothetical protein EP318_18630 [Rhodobacteraceae bacterium]|nr:MAG: hypothetical protein EP318_18630 [Paracoccaceae bacterium]